MNLPRPHVVQRNALLMVLLLALVSAAFTTTSAIKAANLLGTHPARMVFPGAEGPSARVFLEDFPNAKLPPGLGHDGQQFYAIARQPLHPNRIAPDLDRPRYRLQRIAFPLLVWMIHPHGGGKGLITATILVGALSLFAGGMATGLLSLKLGGPHVANTGVCSLAGSQHEYADFHGRQSGPCSRPCCHCFFDRRTASIGFGGRDPGNAD